MTGLSVSGYTYSRQMRESEYPATKRTFILRRLLSTFVNSLRQILSLLLVIGVHVVPEFLQNILQENTKVHLVIPN